MYWLYGENCYRKNIIGWNLIAELFYFIVIGVALYFYSVVIINDEFLDTEFHFCCLVSKSFNVSFIFNISNNCTIKQNFNFLALRILEYIKTYAELSPTKILSFKYWELENGIVLLWFLLSELDSVSAGRLDIIILKVQQWFSIFLPLYKKMFYSYSIIHDFCVDVSSFYHFV